MMKKGQLIGQPFVYIFILIVASLILIFGIRFIIQLNDAGGEMMTKTFLDDIKKNVNSVYADSSGSVKSLESIKVPAKMKEICFADTSLIFNSSKVSDRMLKEYMEEAFDANLEDNVYVSPTDSLLIDLVYVDSLVCDSLEDRKVNLKLINEGHRVLVEKI